MNLITYLSLMILIAAIMLGYIYWTQPVTLNITIVILTYLGGVVGGYFWASQNKN